MRVIVAAGAAGVLALTSACVSASDRASSEATATGSGATPAARICSLLSAAQLGQVLGVAFREPIAAAGSTATATQCQWTATDQTSLVLTKTVSKQADIVYRSAMRESQRSIGAVAPVRIPGATAAYILPSLGRTGMLVGDRYVEVSVLVPSATPGQIRQVATAAAANARRS